MTIESNRIQIRVLGDVAVDWLLAETWAGDQESLPEQSNRVLAIPVLGGAWFVKDFIEAALEAVDAGDDKFPRCKVSTYQFDPKFLNFFGKSIPNAIWDIDRYPRFRDVSDKDSDEKVYRLRRRRLYNRPKAKDVPPQDPEQDVKRPDILVIDDIDIGFRDDAGSMTSVTQCLENNNHCLVILLISGRGIPRRAATENRLWQYLADIHSERTVVVVSANALRHAGAKISRCISWESTAEDYVDEIGAIAGIEKFEHIITRFGLTGVMYSRRPRMEGAKNMHLLAYDPDATDGVFRDPEREGNISGANSVLIAWLVQQAILKRGELLSAGKWDVEKLAKLALPGAIQGCQRLFRNGYGKDEEELNRLLPDWEGIQTENNKRWKHWVSNSVFNLSLREPDGQSHRDSFGSDIDKLYGDKNCTYWVVRIPSQRKAGFEILTDVIPPGESTAAQMFALARDIVKYGVNRTISRDIGSAVTATYPIQVPIARYGKDFVAIDRESIESFQSLSELMRQYIHSRAERPLSIAIFGPPGSGKSFSIKSVAKSVSDRVTFLSCNLTHLRRDTDDLAHEFIRILDASQDNKLPLMLFDEFDCDGLAHIKSFLEPMEDSRFRYGKGELRFGPTIFAFAGGIYEKYDEFMKSVAHLDEDGCGLLFKEEAKNRKVPDFLSRLSGHINILSINATGKNYAFLVRRAILLRSFLEQIGVTSSWRGGIRGQARVADAIINALLGVSRFKFGARSMRSIIQSCKIIEGWIDKVGVPTLDQIDMHVDAKLFFHLLATNESCIISELEKERLEDGDATKIWQYTTTDRV